MDRGASLLWVDRRPLRAQALRGQLHSHPFYEILYITEGVRHLELEGRTYRGCAGDLMLYRPGEVHREWSDHQAGYLALRVSPDLVAETGIPFPDLDGSGPVLATGGSGEILALLDRMHHEYRTTDWGSGELLGAYLTAFLVLVHRRWEEARLAGGATSSRSRLRNVIARLRLRPSLHVDVSQLAEQSGLSLSQFGRLFREETGHSPKRFLILQRIERAKELLRDGGYRAQDIAEILGYAGPFFFYRQFKQETGMTCEAYRRRSLGG